MRPIDSAYDRNTKETRHADPGAGLYALISDHNGPCSIVGQYASLDAAIEAARTMDTDSAPAELDNELGVDAANESVGWLIEKAKGHGWRVVAKAPAGEYWHVLAPEPEAN